MSDTTIVVAASSVMNRRTGLPLMRGTPSPVAGVESAAHSLAELLRGVPGGRTSRCDRRREERAMRWAACLVDAAVVAAAAPDERAAR
ncbi:MAG: hypothetical protein OXN44_00445 [Acidimicrobiaceae bacterium]|nr:hypothetical protein [Acidimicrobiaceae bacterium]